MVRLNSRGHNLFLFSLLFGFLLFLLLVIQLAPSDFTSVPQRYEKGHFFRERSDQKPTLAKLGSIVEKHPARQSDPVLTGTLLLTKTVGTESDECATTSTLNVLSGTPVYFCYVVKNSTNVTLTQHRLTDDNLPIEPLINYILPPGGITQTVRGPVTVTNDIIDIAQTQAFWQALTQDGTQNISARSQASVRVVAPAIEIAKRILPVTEETQASECGNNSTITVPAGIDVQHCIDIFNAGNSDILTLTIEAPDLGISSLTITTRIRENERYSFTAQEAALKGVGAGFRQQNIQSSQSTVVTVTAVTADGFQMGNTDESNINLNGSIAVQVDLFAGTRSGQCDNVFAVTQRTTVYYCVKIANEGTEVLTAQRLLPSTVNEQALVIESALQPNQIITRALGSLTVTEGVTTTVQYNAVVDAFVGTFTLTRTAQKFVGIVPVLLTPTQIPTQVPTNTPAPPTPTATSTRRPLATSTPFPTLTPTETTTPVPNTAVPTHTPISPLPTPTPTPTRLIITAVQSPVSTPTATPTPSATSTPNLAATNEAQQATVAAQSATSSAAAAATGTSAARVAQASPAADAPSSGGNDAVNAPNSPLATPVNTPTFTLVPTATETEIPSATPSGTPTETPLPSQTATPTVSENVIMAAEVRSGADGTSVSNSPPPRGVLILASVIDAAFAAAAWIWFLCGSILFFSVAGLIAGLYFRQQERNRFRLVRTEYDVDIESREQAEEPVPTPEDPSPAPEEPPSSPASAESDHWPASLP